VLLGWLSRQQIAVLSQLTGAEIERAEIESADAAGRAANATPTDADH
jgi:hypothetical protein